MGRSTQLTATAIIALIGSGIALAAGIVALTIPNERRSISILVILAGAWGIATAAGILRRWRWARISILIFAGLTAYAGAAFAPLLAFIRTPVRPVPLAQPSPLMFCIGVVVAAFGMWWVVLFSGNRSKEVFGVNVTSDPTPLSISVIAWYLVITGALGLLSLLRIRQYPPSMHFGFVFMGWSALAATLFYSAIALYPGIGLLRRKRQSPRLAMCYGLFILLDIIAFLFRPDRDARVNAYYRARAVSIPSTVSQSPTSLSHLLQLASIEWGILTLLAVLFLAIHQKAFGVAQKSLQQ